jgi:predicted negative regulator of RcsB-dependent stress response
MNVDDRDDGALLVEALYRIRKCDYEGALDLLKNVSDQATNGESAALRGNAFFMLQKYADAQGAYREALSPFVA